MTDKLPSMPCAKSSLPSLSDRESGDWADRLEIFYGQANPGECRLYARLAMLDAGDGWRLTGRVRGPECRYAQTLPADYPLRSSAPGSDLLAEAFIPDPCFWSPALPQLYWATIELVHNGKAAGSVTRMVGVRPLGARGRSLYWEGKRWVLRGIQTDEVANPLVDDLNAWHDGPTAMLVDDPPDELCQRASLDGVLIVARATGTQTQLTTELARLARWPSVGLAVVNPAEADLSKLRHSARNILLVQYVSSENRDCEITLASGAQAVLLEMGQTESGIASLPNLTTTLRNCSVPLIAYRPSGPRRDVAIGRAACDTLQSDLAPIGDFAGYIV